MYSSCHFTPHFPTFCPGDGNYSASTTLTLNLSRPGVARCDFSTDSDFYSRFQIPDVGRLITILTWKPSMDWDRCRYFPTHYANLFNDNNSLYSRSEYVYNTGATSSLVARPDPCNYHWYIIVGEPIFNWCVCGLVYIARILLIWVLMKARNEDITARSQFSVV